MCAAQALPLRAGDRARLEAITRASTVPAGVARRARIVLLAAVDDLEDAIRAFIDAYNERATPFTWTKTADHELALRAAKGGLQPHGL